MSAPPWASCCPVCPSVPSFLQVAGPCCVLLILGLFLPLQVESSLSGTCTPFQKPVLLRSVALNLSSGRIAGRAFTGSLPQTQAAGGPGFVGLEGPPLASQHSQGRELQAEDSLIFGVHVDPFCQERRMVSGPVTRFTRWVASPVSSQCGQPER